MCATHILFAELAEQSVKPLLRSSNLGRLEFRCVVLSCDKVVDANLNLIYVGVELAC